MELVVQQTLAGEFVDMGSLHDATGGTDAAKAKVVEQHPTSMRPRHAVAPMAVLGLAASPLAIVLRPFRPLIAAAAVGYCLLVAVGVKKADPDAHGASKQVLVAAFPVMHAAWGAGFIQSILERFTNRSTS